MLENSGNLIKQLASRVKIYLVIIALLFIILCFYDTIWIIPSMAIYALIIVYTIWVNSKKNNELAEHIEEVTTDVNMATKNTLINSPIPLLLVETDGNIIWKSKKFIQEFKGIEIGTYIENIVKEIKIEIEKNEIEGSMKDFEIVKQFNIDGKIYKIRGGYARSKKRDKRKQKEYILTLYFIDDTKYNELFDELNNSKHCIGIAMIDNYDEVAQRLLPEEKPQLIAAIEKAIYDWISESGGLIVKSERDTFVCVFEQQFLKKFQDEKFNILDKVKTININMKVPITLSIAVSNEGKTVYEKYKSALAAMDIVLGRGGDQAIVRKDGKYKFYGGKTLEVEKRTKVKARIISNALEKLIVESPNVIIMGHNNPDIDAVGSALGLYRLAKTLNTECYIATESTSTTLGKYKEILESNEEYKEILLPIEKLEDKKTDESLLIVVDTHKKNFVEYPELLEGSKKIVVIDHHRKATEYIENPILSFHEVYASSTAELVAEIIQYSESNAELTVFEAESLYGGIMVDTKDFTFKTGVRTFEAAAYLRRFGVDIIKVKKWFQADLESYNTIAEIVKNAEVLEKSIAISVYDIESKDANLICAKAADELLTISDIAASFVLGNLGDKICISGRSLGDINVQVILEKLGGGGHITLAGAQLEGVTIQEATDELIIRINEYLSEIG